jgi:hypothetical protein
MAAFRRRNVARSTLPELTHPEAKMPIAIQLSTPNNQQDFPISDAPQMPGVTVDAVVTPPTPNAAKAQFRWTVQLRFAGTETPKGKPGTPLDLNKTTTGGRLVINPADWGRLRGGNLTVSVTATIDGQTASARLQGLRIVGTNPTPAAVRTALGTDVLRRIANQESGFCQFGDDGWPNFSSDNLGGAGIMQITPASEDQRWNWRTNVQAGIQKYNQCYALTATYVQSVRTSPQVALLVQALNRRIAADQQDAVTQAVNQKHPPKQPPRLLTVTVPDWTAEQRMHDAIRGYNGWAGKDPVVPNLHLHEYRISRDAGGELQVTLIPNTLRAEAIWEQVPPADRPQGVGDPDYVAHVLAQSA